MFCDYCPCEGCKVGEDHMSHAQTADGRWICDVCYLYDLCTANGPNRNWSGPCKDKNCIHRPKIVSEWVRFKDMGS